MFKKKSVIVLFFALLPLFKGETIAVETVSVQLFANSENVGFEVYRAMDGVVGSIWHTQYFAKPRDMNLCPHPITCGYFYACGYDHPEATVPASHGMMSLPMNTERFSWLNTPNDNGEDAERAKLFGFAKTAGNAVPGPHALGIDLGGVKYCQWDGQPYFRL